MSLAQELAQELIDLILDFLYDDIDSLLSSSLVARKWVPAARYHLFQRIVLNHWHCAPGSGYSFQGSAYRFLNICTLPECTILSSMQEVVLNIDNEHESDSEAESGWLVPGLLEELIRVIATAPLAKLVYIDHTKSWNDPIALTWIAPRFPRLRQFTYNALDRFLSDALALVASFPELEVLSLYSTTLEDNFEEAIMPPKPYPLTPPNTLSSLKTLRLQLFSHQPEEFMAWLLTFGDRIRLEILNLDLVHYYHNGWGRVDALNAYFNLNGAHLRNFGLRLHYEENSELDVETFLSRESDGDCMTSLLLLSPFLILFAVDLICTALSSLPLPSSTEPPNHLHSLEVSFREWIHYYQVQCPCDPVVLVQDFADAMSSEQFSRLAEFTILVPVFFGENGAKALRAYFPRWEETDIMRVGFIEERRFPADSWERLKDELSGER
ncbi:hypothetical protein R3P38DRAFT_2932980 [Favolaschia claudopus]|uniref:F-box domain-containing protein n=1 Tax=Favolaschia claudopus TaxID=2862362 RepID=A0AAW0BT73_9AGAR